MLAIYKRELKAYFHSFIGFLFIAVTLFFIGLYYSYYNLICGYPYFSYSIGSIMFVFLLSIPVLSMRILAEERRSKTDQLILTAPVTVGQIVFGKFLALCTILAIPTLISCFYPLMLRAFGTIPMAEAYLAILDFFLFGMACIAVGVFVSSLTESQVIAAVLGFVFLFIGYMMPSLCSLLSADGNLLTRILGIYDLYTPFDTLLNGTLEVGSIVYFLSVTALFLFFTTQAIQKRRYSVSVKSLKFGAYSTFTTVCCIGVVVVINMLVGQLPVQYTSIDVTSNKLYSLTDETKDYIKNLDQDVTLYVLVQEKDQDTTLGQTLQRIDELSSHITLTYIDPVLNPKFQSKYSSSALSNNSIIVENGNRFRTIDYYDLYQSEIDYSTYQSQITGYDGEGQILSAISYVISDNLPKTYMVKGHGEQSLETSFSSTLAKQNVEYEDLNLMDVDQIPEDAQCVLINAPSSDFSTDDLAKLTDYLDRGGDIILVTGYTEKELTNVKKLAGYMNLEIAEGLVMESSQNYFYQLPYYILPSVESMDYTSGIAGKKYIFAPYSQGIIVPQEEQENIYYETILSTSDSSFSKVNLQNTRDYTKEEGDISGPFALGVLAVKTLEEGSASMVVFSCTQIFTETVDAMVSGANSLLFTNVMSAFVSTEGTNLISIPVKSYDVSSVMVSNQYLILIGGGTTILLPILNLIAGFIVWLKRRKG